MDAVGGRAARGIAVAAILSGLLLQGCALPRSGPMAHEVAAANASGQIELIPVTPEIALANREPSQASFPARFKAAKPVDYEQLAPGDGVRVGIWERDGLGVFPPGSTGFADLGELIVSKVGTISIPYVGAVPTAGRTTAEVRDIIIKRLRGLIVASDVSVAQTPTKGRFVTVQGDLTKPGVYPIIQGMLRLSALLGMAVPNQTDPEQTAVTVRREGEAATVRLSDVYRDPTQDIALQADDSVVVSAVDYHLVVLGAAGAQGRLKVTKRNYTILDALADSRGLSDVNASPRAVFLMRRAAPGDAAAAGNRPVVYQFDFRRPGQMVLAGEFATRDGDAIYVSDAPFTQVEKVLSVFSSTLGTARSADELGQ